MRLNYDNISPISGKQSVLSEYDDQHQCWMHLCMDTGYHTYDKWKIGSEAVELFEKSCPELVISSKIAFGDQLWYKIIMMTYDTIIYPDVYDGDYIWKVTNFKSSDNDEEIERSPIKIVVPTPDGPEIKIVDDENAKIFGELNFEDAVIEFHRLNSLILY